MARKLKVAVLMGGRTAEHEVSLATGRVIVEALDKRKYNVKPIIITKEGKWLVPSGYVRQIEGPEAADRGETVTIRTEPKSSALLPLSAGFALDKAIEEKVDVVFIAMHGPYGEDGTVQGLLEMVGIPYTGSGVLASSLAMNKAKSRELFEHNGIAAPKYSVFNLWEWKREKGAVIAKMKKSVGLPCVIKPVELGSSVGVSIVKTEEEFTKGFKRALEYGNEVLVEEYIAGDEVTCAVLGNLPGEEPVALAPTQIIPKKSGFFDYEAKYTPGATEEITPARIDEELIRKVQEIAVLAHKTLGCAGLSRTDMIIRSGKVYVLETNTIPGMTEISLYPQAARAVGIEFPELLDRIIELALADHNARKSQTHRL